MPRGITPERCGLNEETTLETLLRRHPGNGKDSLIAYHLGISKEEVAAARAKFTPQKMRGSWFSKTDRVSDTEYAERRKLAEQANSEYLAALTRVHG